jgi:hypothetical protein
VVGLVDYLIVLVDQVDQAVAQDETPVLQPQ